MKKLILLLFIPLFFTACSNDIGDVYLESLKNKEYKPVKNLMSENAYFEYTKSLSNSCIRNATKFEKNVLQIKLNEIFKNMDSKEKIKNFVKINESTIDFCNENKIYSNNEVIKSYKKIEESIIDKDRKKIIYSVKLFNNTETQKIFYVKKENDKWQIQ